MTIKQLINRLTQTILDGDARDDDNVIMVEYDRIHLRPAKGEHDAVMTVKDGITLTREPRPIHQESAR